MKNEWKVALITHDGCEMYAAYKLIDINKPDVPENRKFRNGYYCKSLKYHAERYAKMLNELDEERK